MDQDNLMPPQVIDSLIRREQLSLVGRLLRGLVHNLSGALQTVRLPLDLLEMQAARGGEQNLDQKLPAIQQGLTRMGDELNILANLSQQMYRIEPETLDLCELVRDQLSLWLADMFFKHELQLETQLPQPGPKVRSAYADAALAFNLLLANALEALQEAGQKGLAASAFTDGGQAVLRLVDQGPGPSPEMAPKMFEPFAGHKEDDHDGLGLFLAQAALQRWNGRVKWLNDPPGAFEIRLPLAAD